MSIRLFFLYALSVGLLVATPLRADPLADNQSRVGPFHGDVQLLSAGAAKWIEPHEGLPLESGDEISTGEDGQVDLILSEETYWRLEPNTDVILEFAESHAGRVSLVSGSLIATVDLARAAAPVWTLNTPAGLCTSRGGEYGVSFMPEAGLHLAIFKNEVEWQGAETESGEQPIVRTSAGKEIILRRGKPVKTTDGWTAPMHARYAALGALHKDRLTSDQTWTPWTETTRSEIRKKFVPPAPKHITRRKPPPVRHRKGAVPDAL